MKQRNDIFVITDELERRFRSSIEGCIPDLIEANDQRDMLGGDPTEEDRDSIYDYAADRAYDTFPNVPHEERNAMAKRIANYFCGEEEIDTTAKFKVAALRHDTRALTQAELHVGEKK
jgi:hypothetical protein